MIVVVVVVGLWAGEGRISTLHATFKRNRLLELESWLLATYPETWACVLEELNGTALQHDDDDGTNRLPDKVVVDGQEFTIVDAETGRPLHKSASEDKFRSAVNLPGSAGFDVDKARRDRQLWLQKVAKDRVQSEDSPWAWPAEEGDVKGGGEGEGEGGRVATPSS